MQHLKLLTISLIAVAVFSVTASAQRKPARKTPPKTPAPKIVPPLEVRAAREKVSIQLSNVDRFIDVLGPIAQGIEETDEAAKSSPLPKETEAKNEENKRKVIAAIRNLGDGLRVLEAEFRTKSELQKYLPAIQGITDLAASSEDMAIAGKFVAAKDPLREVSLKLTDTLVAMPK
ncbi:MAG: hypothetical protein AB7J13_07430 [Pyrinomonadaceae bacterium]